MSRLRANPIIAARDFYYSYILYEEELQLARGAGYFSRMADCFRVPRIRRGNYGASTVMIAQQMCGINSKSPLRLCQWSSLTPYSHLLLQLDYLRKCWVHSYPGLVCLSGLWCYPGRGYDPYSVPDRHQRP